jgi:hypothetical protein
MLVEGDCMAPAARDGNYAIAHQIQYPAAGDLAVIWFKGKRTPWIKRVIIAPLAESLRMRGDVEAAVIVGTADGTAYPLRASKIDGLHHVVRVLRAGQVERYRPGAWRAAP